MTGQPPITLPDVVKLLSNMSIGNIHPQKQPSYSDGVQPVFKDQLILGLEEQNDLRRFTQIKLWIKPPSQRFPKANAFMSLVNTKGSVFVRLNSLEELEALRTWLDNAIPQMRTIIEEQKPLEVQMAAANAAFDVIANAKTNDDHDGD